MAAQIGPGGEFCVIRDRHLAAAIPVSKPGLREVQVSVGQGALTVA